MDIDMDIDMDDETAALTVPEKQRMDDVEFAAASST